MAPPSKPPAVAASSSVGGMPTDFEWSYTDEPHASRRKVILEKHPEIKQLFGVDPYLRYKILLVVSIQIAGAVFASTLESFWALFLLTYCLSGTLNHSLTLGMHEVSHNLAFKALFKNRVLGLICNLPLGIPSFVAFKHYHMVHHKYQGEQGLDVDIPSHFEGRFVSNTFAKLIWVILQPFAYSLRPLIVMPKPMCRWEFINICCAFMFDAALYYYLGWQAVFYCVFGTLLGMGLHPMAGHFIAEHYTFIKGQETYSYYGPLNWLSFNVGYHNEHHDFPFVPGSRLPAVRAMAPEYYDTLPCHTSWVQVIWRYITDPTVGPYSRVMRKTVSDADRADVWKRGSK
eukprot:TRINITY_DN21179_c0_g1_i1.p1 TRINITY_DN21179_c0_g1~~TRINITY_DN21179_c0_g1_i1.p1  ORF type:complete len:344 (+),score=40.78 TRINITY_DN21179_c0_g1_i1:97-1128(+)